MPNILHVSRIKKQQSASQPYEPNILKYYYTPGVIKSLVTDCFFSYNHTVGIVSCSHITLFFRYNFIDLMLMFEDKKELIPILSG